MSNPLLPLCLNHLRNLVGFNTCNPPKAYSESGIIKYIQQVFDLPKVKIEIMDYGNDSINILITKGNPSLLFNFHMDTVPTTDGWNSNPFELYVTENKAYGLGACDTKGSAAAMLAVIQTYHTEIDHFALLFSSDEEHGNSTCIKKFLEKEHNYKGIIVAEPTQAKAVTAHRGINTFTLRIKGNSGHSSEKRALTDNCIHKFSQWASKSLAMAKDFEQMNYQNLSGICFNIGKVQGGIKPNIIANELFANFGVRPLPEQGIQSIKEEILSFLEDGMFLEDNFKAPSLPAKKNQSHNHSNPNQELAEELDLPTSEAVNFWTEASLFSEAGYPSIVYGSGNIAQAHAPNEFVELEQLQEILLEYHRILHHE